MAPTETRNVQPKSKQPFCHPRLDRLTPRELEVLDLIANGLSTADIANRLHRSQKTIKTHRLALGRKLGVTNRVELARIAIETGLSQLPGITSGETHKLNSLLKEEAERRNHLEKVLHEINQTTDAASGEAFFQTLAKHLATAIGAKIALVGRMSEEGKVIQTIATWIDTGPGENFAFSIAGTPCEIALREGKFFQSSGVREAFDLPDAVASLPLESYFGFALTDREGRAIGILAAVHDEPIVEVYRPETILRVFAGPASYELQRLLDDEKQRDEVIEIDTQITQKTSELKLINNDLRREIAGHLTEEELLRTEKNELTIRREQQIQRFDELNETIKREVKRRIKAETGMQVLAEGSIPSSGDGYFQLLVKHLAKALRVRHVIVSSITDESREVARIMAAISDCDLKPGEEYSLKGTPCGTVISQTSCYYPEGVRELFPDDHALQAMAVDCYLGVALFSSDGRPIGLIAVMNDRPLEDPAFAQSILQVFASRVASELARLQVEAQLTSNRIRQKVFFASTIDPFVVIDTGGIIQSVSDSVERVFHWKPSELIGRNVNVLMPEPHSSKHDSYLQRYQESGETNIMGRTREFQGVRKDGSIFPIEVTVWRMDIPGEDAPLYTGIIRDITARKKTESQLLKMAESERLLRRELNHRVRNNLTSLISLIGLTRRSASDVDEFASTMTHRVQAMADVHTHLCQRNWSPSSIPELIATVSPVDMVSRIDFQGEGDVLIPASKSGALATVFHELLINSLKYGSLASEKGRIELAFSIVDRQENRHSLELIWTESGGEALDEEPRPGIGTEIIRGIIKSDLQGSANFCYPNQGAHHRFRIQLQCDELNVV